MSSAFTDTMGVPGHAWQRCKGRRVAPPELSVELSDDCFDTPDTGGGTLFLLDLESLDVRSVLDVGSTAEFAGHIADGVDLDHFTVFVGEDTDGTTCHGLLVRHLLADDGDCGLDGIVDILFHGLELLGSTFPIEVEVESEPLSGDVGSLLLYVRTDELPECGVEEMCGGVELRGLHSVALKKTGMSKS